MSAGWPTTRGRVRCCHGNRRGRSAFVLVGVLVVVMLLSMVAASLMFSLKAENTAALSSAGAEQAWAAAMSGIEEAMRVARLPGSMEFDRADAPGLFKDRLVADDGVNRWYFTVFSPGEPDGSGALRYGLTDEAGKLNLNNASETNLLRLPRMTRSLAHALLDFLDADDAPHPEGAEQEYYDALPRPYKIRNGPLRTLDELLLVRGFTPAAVYGEDANTNFRLDPNENDSDETAPPDDGDGKLDLGLRQYLTVSSYEYDHDAEGNPRVNLNEPSDPLPRADLPEALTNCILVLRSNNITLTHPAELLEARFKVKDAAGRDTEVPSGVGKEELARVLDLFTTHNELTRAGLVNVNTASAEVLAALPGLDEGQAEAIVSARRGLSADRKQTIAWLYTEDVLPAEAFKAVAPYLTARGRQYSFHVVGYGVPCGRFRVLDVVIDCAPAEPVIAYVRDLTRLGMPFPVSAGEESEGLASSSLHPGARMGWRGARGAGKTGGANG